MSDETIVAVYDTADHADRAVRELEAAGVPSSAISRHAKTDLSAGAAPTSAPVHDQGFWASLFGTEPEHHYDTSIYGRSVESGSTVVTVKTSQSHLTTVMDILERHNPIDLDERATSYGLSQSASTGASSPPATGGETLPLSEETLSVGKRAVNRGTTRVRRYVVETPVEEQISLRDETVSVERRPVTDAHPVASADFSDKVVEMTETIEEAVVSKTARVKEEVVVRKDATERTETVRDTVRHEDVEITKDPNVERTSSGVGAMPAAPRPKV